MTPAGVLRCLGFLAALVACAACNLFQARNVGFRSAVTFQPGQPPRAPQFWVEGDVRVGPAELAGNAGGGLAGNAGGGLAGNAGGGLAGNAGGGLAGNAGGGLVGNAGSGLIGNAGSGLTLAAGLSNVTPLAAAPALSAGGVSALSGVPSLVGNAGAGLVGNAGAGLAGNAGGGYRIQTEDIRVIVEVVNPATGALHRRVRTNAFGHYRVEVDSALRNRGLVVQATALTRNAVSAFLAAPIPAVPPDAAVTVVDVSPASTVVVFSAALLAGVRGEFKVDPGFRGFAAPLLATLISRLDPAAAAQAGAKLDQAKQLYDSDSFDAILEKIVAGSVAVAAASARFAAQSGQTAADAVAAHNLVLRGLSGLPLTSDADVPAAVGVAVEKVTVEAVREEAAKIAGGDDSADVGIPSLLLTPTPAPTPTPTPEPTASPIGGFVIRP